jgi:integrase
MNRPRTKNKHLPRCVYEKHGAFWHVRKGKWTRIGGTLREALATYAALYESPQGGVSELIDEAVLALKGRWSANTAKQYAIAAKKLKKVFAEFQPEQIKPKHVAKLKTSFASKPNMGNRVLSFGRMVFDWALEQQRVELNPFVGISRHPEAKRGRLLNADEYQLIYGKAGPRLQVIMDLLRMTGQRVTAVLKIHRADLIEEGIRFPKFKTPTKRIVKWSPELRAVVDRAKTLHGNIRALTLLHNRRGKAPDYRSVQKQWADACTAAGILDAQLRDLRAVAATTAKKQGKDATALLGHTNEQQTKRYLRDKEEPLVEAPSFGHPIDNTTKS